MSAEERAAVRKSELQLCCISKNGRNYKKEKRSFFFRVPVRSSLRLSPSSSRRAVTAAKRCRTELIKGIYRGREPGEAITAIDYSLCQAVSTSAPGRKSKRVRKITVPTHLNFCLSSFPPPLSFLVRTTCDYRGGSTVA